MGAQHEQHSILCSRELNHQQTVPVDSNDRDVDGKMLVVGVRHDMMI